MILHIDSSINGDASVTRHLSASIVERLQSTASGQQVTYHDLGDDPIPHLTLNALADHAWVDEFLEAKTIVLGAPMYNFGVPSNLKAWLDRIAIQGRTFRYTEHGPQGLAGSKRVIVASSRGGFYGPETPLAAAEHQESHLRTFFGFLGVEDISIIRAEGLAFGPDARANAIAHAVAEISALE